MNSVKKPACRQAGNLLNRSRLLHFIRNDKNNRHAEPDSASAKIKRHAEPASGRQA